MYPHRTLALGIGSRKPTCTCLHSTEIIAALGGRFGPQEFALNGLVRLSKFPGYGRKLVFFSCSINTTIKSTYRIVPYSPTKYHLCRPAGCTPRSSYGLRTSNTSNTSTMAVTNNQTKSMAKQQQRGTSLRTRNINKSKTRPLKVQ